MSKAEKVIPQKITLRSKKLKNNWNASFQIYAEKLYGCHGNIHDGWLVKQNFSGKLLEKEVIKQQLQTLSRFEDILWFW